MSRVQLALDVDDLEQAVDFYTRLLGVEPAKRRPGYANFAVADPPLKLVLLENPGRGGSLNHLGIEVESTEVVHDETARLTEAGLLTLEENDTTCCYATQDKVWVTGPGGERWEVYTVKADSQEFGVAPVDAPAAGRAGSGADHTAVVLGDDHRGGAGRVKPVGLDPHPAVVVDPQPVGRAGSILLQDRRAVSGVATLSRQPCTTWTRGTATRPSVVGSWRSWRRSG